MLDQLAEQLLRLRASRARVLEQVEKIVEAHPLHELLMSLPAVGVRTAARIITAAAQWGGHLGRIQVDVMSGEMGR